MNAAIATIGWWYYGQRYAAGHLMDYHANKPKWLNPELRWLYNPNWQPRPEQPPHPNQMALR